MGSEKNRNIAISPNTIENIKREMEQISTIQNRLMKEAKSLLSSAEIKQIEESYRQYESQIKAIQEKADQLRSQFIPMTKQLRELIEKSVITSQKIEGCYVGPNKKLEEEVKHLMKRYNVQVSAQEK